MVCRYHQNENEMCPVNCAMRGVFPSEIDDVHGEYHTLREIMGGLQVLLRFFQAVNTVEERRVVARALSWICSCWFLYPAGGPREAFQQLEIAVNTLAPPQFEPPEPPGFNYESHLDNIMVPFVLIGPLPFRRRAPRLGRECRDDCILRPVFPPNSCPFAFDSLYNRYGRKLIIPRHFGRHVDLPSREGIANSLLWEAAGWNVNPVGGPMVAYNLLLRRYALLDLVVNQNLPLQVGANAADADEGGGGDPPQIQMLEPLHNGANAADAGGGDPGQVLEGGEVANLQLVVAEPPRSQPQEGNALFPLEGPLPFILEVGGAMIQIFQNIGDGHPPHLLLQVFPQLGGDVLLQISFGDGADVLQEVDDPHVLGANVVDGVDGARPLNMQLKVGGGGMIRLFRNIAAGHPPQRLLQVFPQLGGDVLIRITFGDPADVLQEEDNPPMMQVGGDGGVHH